MDLSCEYPNYSKTRTSGILPGKDVPRGYGKVEALVQDGFEYDASKMSAREALEDTIIWLRQRYGNKVIQRGAIYTDPLLGKLDAKANHTIHPIGVFYRGGLFSGATGKCEFPHNFGW